MPIAPTVHANECFIGVRLFRDIGGVFFMRKRMKRRMANAAMIAVILLLIAAGLYFVGKLRGWV